jgi:hypothetical protein
MYFSRTVTLKEKVTSPLWLIVAGAEWIRSITDFSWCFDCVIFPSGCHTMSVGYLEINYILMSNLFFLHELLDGLLNVSPCDAYRSRESFGLRVNYLYIYTHTHTHTHTCARSYNEKYVSPGAFSIPLKTKYVMFFNMPPNGRHFRNRLPIYSMKVNYTSNSNIVWNIQGTLSGIQ